MPINKLSRRRVVAGGAAIGLVGAPFVRRANAAGNLTIGLWDHWVPGANDVQSDIMEFTNWESAQHNAALEPVDDVVKSVVARNGPIDPAVEYLGKFEGKWL